METIYHITTKQRWRDAEHSNQYEPESFQLEGFIHCSTADQVVRVANYLFRNTQNLVLLHIKTALLHFPLVYENLEGGAELFPHVYGPINIDAVVHVSAFEPGLDGSFDHHIGTIE